MLFCWIFYAGLTYTFFTPEHQYLDVLDNARTLYLWIHVPLQILMTFVLVVVTAALKNTSSYLPEVVDKLRASGDIKKWHSEYQKFNSFRMKSLMNINRLYYAATAMVVFIGLGDTTLGLVMLWGVSIGALLMSSIGSFFKEVTNALS